MRLTFSLETSLSEEDRRRIVDAVERAPGVDYVAPVRPEAKHPVARSLYFADISEHVDPSVVCSRIRELRGVISCSVPAERYLVGWSVAV